jgi:outer membrane protein TolC
MVCRYVKITDYLHIFPIKKNILLAKWATAFILLLCSQLGLAQQKFTLDEAMQFALAQSPELQAQQQRVLAGQGQLLMAQGAFDYKTSGGISWGQNRRNVLPLPIFTDFDRILRDTFGVTTVLTNSSSMNIGLMRQFRNGVYVQTMLGTSRIVNDMPFPAPFEQFTSQNFNSFRIQAGVPLLFNRGGLISKAAENAGKEEVEALSQQAIFAASIQIYKVVAAYWAYVGAWKSIESYKNARQRAADMLENSRLLVEAEKMPASDLVQLEADVADKNSLLLYAEQAYFEAKQHLGTAIGLDYQQSQALGEPLNAFPIIEEIGDVDALQVAQFEAQLSERNDLLAQKEMVEAQKIRMAAAEQGLLPRLDLGVYAQRSGMQYGNGLNDYTRAYSAFEGRNIDYGVNISLQVPIQNSTAKGHLMQTGAQLKESQIQYDNQLRQIKNSLAVAINQLKISKQVLQQRKEALDKAAMALQHEQEKYKEGFSTVIQVLLAQERLISAELQYAQANQHLASALAFLRFETGTVFVSGAVNANIFYHLPTQK